MEQHPAPADGPGSPAQHTETTTSTVSRAVPGAAVPPIDPRHERHTDPRQEQQSLADSLGISPRSSKSPQAASTASVPATAVTQSPEPTAGVSAAAPRNSPPADAVISPADASRSLLLPAKRPVVRTVRKSAAASEQPARSALDRSSPKELADLSGLI
eukprot:TRINITY_DN32256_c0_g1_i1.p1 TRINITY_DN32256_c0_g1~~TRINITY_DN32256_c0_g1_i1.p1  ORF type:complete len:158 (+),score=30.27 TRINITY_DN32256_c0_g1_i1:149-622(+)